MRMIDVLEDACGRKAERIMLPMQARNVPATYGDITVISRDTGYASTTSIEVGVPKFVEWYRQYTGT